MAEVFHGPFFMGYPLVFKHGNGKSLWMEVFCGKLLIDGPFSIALFDYRRVYPINHHISHRFPIDHDISPYYQKVTIPYYHDKEKEICSCFWPCGSWMAGLVIHGSGYLTLQDDMRKKHAAAGIFDCCYFSRL